MRQRAIDGRHDADEASLGCAAVAAVEPFTAPADFEVGLPRFRRPLADEIGARGPGLPRPVRSTSFA